MNTLIIPNRAVVAEAIGTSDQYLYQIESGRRQASRLMASAIERETGGQVTRHQLRPDLFQADGSPIANEPPQKSAAPGQARPAA